MKTDITTTVEYEFSELEHSIYSLHKGDERQRLAIITGCVIKLHTYADRSNGWYVSLIGWECKADGSVDKRQNRKNRYIRFPKYSDEIRFCLELVETTSNETLADLMQQRLEEVVAGELKEREEMLAWRERNLAKKSRN